MAQIAADEWKEATKSDTYDTLVSELEKLLLTAPSDQLERWRSDFEGFKGLFKRFLNAKPTITWSNIEPLPEGAIKPYAELTDPAPSETQALLSKLIVAKLNGGLGTTMGCVGPKSAINVREELTFLDLTMRQMQILNEAYGVDVPLVLMNSFNTDADTKKILRKYKHLQVSVYCFNQSCYPRIDKETLTPIATSVSSGIECWYPPGHGDFYEAFSKSGFLDQFLSQGKEYCFIANMDNLCATVDLSKLVKVYDHAARVSKQTWQTVIVEEANVNYEILEFLIYSGGSTEFIMEVTDKTRADIKGQTLTQYEGKLMALDIAQVPKGHEEEFKNVNKFKVFNTNNIWVSLSAVKRLVHTNQLDMEIIVNPKHISAGGGIDLLQLETAVGAAIKCFNGAIGVNVPRRRFLPVKKTQDLFLVMSNLYELDQGTLVQAQRRLISTPPLVKLGAFFDKVQDFLKRFPEIPDILELDHLTVSGDVRFGRAITLKGTVIIIANYGERIDIPHGAFLENKIVSGNLRILDH